MEPGQERDLLVFRLPTDETQLCTIQQGHVTDDEILMIWGTQPDKLNSTRVIRKAAGCPKIKAAAAAVKNERTNREKKRKNKFSSLLIYKGLHRYGYEILDSSPRPEISLKKNAQNGKQRKEKRYMRKGQKDYSMHRSNWLSGAGNRDHKA